MRPALLQVAFVSALALLTFSLNLFSNEMGRYMPAVHGDWANHAATARAIFLGEDFSSATIKNTLDEFAEYPKLTYLAASKIAQLLDISPVQGLSIVVSLAIIGTCLFYALRLAKTISDKRARDWLVLAVLAAILIGCAVLRIGFRDLVYSNSFVSQLVSIALAQIFLYIALRIHKVWQLTLLFAASSIILVNVHLIGFIWCVSSLVLMAFGLPKVSLRKKLGVGILGAMFGGFSLAGAPGAIEMITLAGTGGDLRIADGINLSGDRSIFVIFVAIYALASYAAFRRWKSNRESVETALWQGAGFLSLGPLVVASAYTVLTRGGNWYPVAKWVYLLFPELLLFLLLVTKKVGQDAACKLCNFFVIVPTLFVAQLPYLRPRIDLQPVILAENGLREEVDMKQRRYPGLHVQHPALNWYISRSILKTPTDAVTNSWIVKRSTSVSDLGPDAFVSVAPRISPDQLVRFRSGEALAGRMLDNKWWDMEPNHVWASQQPARIVFYATSTPARLKIGAVPFLSQGVNERIYSLKVNDRSPVFITLKEMNWSSPTINTIEIPKGIVTDNGKMVLEIGWSPTSPNDLGIALTSIEYESIDRDNGPGFGMM